MKVKFLDLGKMHEPIREELHNAAIRVLDSSMFIGGSEVEMFEREMAGWLGVDKVCGCGCATDGLFAVLKAKGIGPGDEVITTVHTAIATIEAISLTGAQFVFCDLGNDSFNLDLDQMEKKITNKTRALIPVHLYGHPVNMDRALAIAQKYNLFLLEDCAQAQGAKYKGKKVGTMGDAGVFSFFPSKNLGGFGDGGAVTARDPDLSRKIRMFLNHGRESKFDHEFEGMNSRLDALQAALLRICLPHLDEWNEGRRRVAAWYDEGLKGIRQVRTSQASSDSEPVYHLYVIVVPDREALIKHLRGNGIESGIHYPVSLNLQPAFQYLREGRGFYPRAEYACGHMLSLPMSHVVTKEETQFVCETISEFYAKNGQ
ncbi:MAG: dTDP-3-amino-3,6-dideoxy-alpha-D-galactopyranose transaminase [Syntrophus sp. PtaB.Bin001]|nr:MAG: dTDP-3-amino-3,6-dideoxy-alpha-D-galactopyranose transaminase [Syntrophus sp. PtaB.Bin001]